jgi:outer membrane protein OmpA-like peptidoglycan-associated protein
MKNRTSFRIPILAALLYAASAVPLAAQYQGLSLGLGVEGNGITLIEGIGLGGQFAVEARLSRRFALDFHLGASTFFSKNFDTAYSFVAMEAMLYPRWYFLAPEDMTSPGVELFAGPGVGVLATVSNMDFHESRGSPEVGVIAGARFRLTRSFYVEPYIRAGYPTLVSVGIMAGIRFPSARGTAARTVKGSEKDVRTVIVERVVERETSVMTEGKTLGSVYFPPDTAWFEGLDAALVSQNRETLKEAARLLKERPSAWLLLEGHANPVYGTERWLKTLSEERAAYAERALIDWGVSPERLVTVGRGGNRPDVPLEDEEHWGQNRRVDLRIFF